MKTGACRSSTILGFRPQAQGVEPEPEEGGGAGEPKKALDGLPNTKFELKAGGA